MSFRHTAITEFIYRGGSPDEVDAIADVLAKYGHFEWQHTSMNGLGYFHGIIKDLNGSDIKNEEETIIADVLEKCGVRIKIVLE